MNLYRVICCVIGGIFVFTGCCNVDNSSTNYKNKNECTSTPVNQKEDADSARIMIRPITNEQVMNPHVRKDGQLEPIPVKGERKMVGRLYDSSKESGAHIDLAITYRTKDKMVHEMAVIPCPNNTEDMKITVDGLGAELEQTHFDAQEGAFLGEASGTLVITYDNGKKTEEPFRVRFKMPL